MSAWQAKFDTTPSDRFWGHRTPVFSKLLVGVALLMAIGYLALQAWLLGRQHLEAADIAVRTQQLAELAQPRPLTGLSDGLGRSGAHAIALAPGQRRELNRVIRQLNTPWPQVFDQIEQTTPSDIALIGIEPDGSRALRIEAESKSLDRLLRYAASLEHRGVFGKLLYSKHEVNTDDPNRPVRLSFQLALQSTHLQGPTSDVAEQTVQIPGEKP